jgi:hypothetical protein
MIIVNIIGGLGNQMFQYAVGKALAERNKQPLKLDITEFQNCNLRKYELTCFNIQAQIASKEEIYSYKYAPFNRVNKLSRKLFKRDILKNTHYLQEKHYHFDSDILNSKGNVYLLGYWQSEKYFTDVKEIILKDFTFKQPLSSSAQKYEQNILSHNAVSIHIRRGDYVNNSATNSYHGTCSLNYYTKAIEIILNNTPESKFYIFSDDLTWAKANLNFIHEPIFVELGADSPDYEEMYLMSQCKHNIIANSSFSWWAAWLNQNPNKIVISPKKWFADTSINTDDLIPSTWINV